MTDMTDRLIRIEWDRIGGSSTCVTVDGQPFFASAIKLEWPGERREAGRVPTLTLTQVILPLPYGEPSRETTVGYLVPCDQWEAYQRRGASCHCRAVLEAHAAALERTAIQDGPLGITSRHIAEDVRYLAGKLPQSPAPAWTDTSQRWADRVRTLELERDEARRALEIARIVFGGAFGGSLFQTEQWGRELWLACWMVGVAS